MSQTIETNPKKHFYPVEIKAKSIHNLYKYVDVSRHVFIITDKNVEKLYLDIVKKQFIFAHFLAINPGEESKSFDQLYNILSHMQSLKLDRNILVIGLGGGVVGDLAGLVAALYLRGVDFLSIPTTTLSQIDSSVGGKVAINLNGIKNVVGTFYHPLKVIIDPDLLKTLPLSDYNSGLVEAVKMGLLFDEELFEIFLNNQVSKHIDEIINRAIRAKSKIVLQDEKDLGIRQLLNFGHTLGHALEAKYGFSHGQCVMLGMIYTVTNEKIKNQLIEIAQKLQLYYEIDLSEDLYDLMNYDKKMDEDFITLAQVDEIGKGYLKQYPKTYLWELLNVK